MGVILYTTHCPKCMILEKKLNMKNIAFDVNENANEMIAKGFMSAPILEVDGKIMDFTEAVKWTNTLN